MSKLTPAVTTAFTLAYTKEELEKQKRFIEEKLDELANLEGPTGPRGPQGARGLTGAQGPKGDKGVKGDKGDRGDVGPKGEKGERGDKGPTGEKGEVGPKGERGEVGPQGERGPAGPQGEKGDAGPKGDKGDRGFTGPQGRKGEKGPQGSRGEKGPKGERGEKGPVGPQGPIGPQGLRGPKGDKGEKGDPGTPAPDYEPRFEALLQSLNKELKKNQDEVSQNLKLQINNINRALSTLGGGGSYRILDNEDVVKTRKGSVADDSILIFDKSQEKFKTESLIDALNRSGFNPGSGGGIANIIAGTGIDVDVDSAANSTTISITDTGVTAGEYGSSNQIPRVTVDPQGRITDIDVVPVSGGAGTGTTIIADISKTIFSSLVGFTTTVDFDTYNISSIVSYIAKNKNNNHVVSIDAEISDSDITFNSNVDLSNLIIEVSYLTPISTTNISTFTISSGTSYTLSFASNSITDIINFFVLNPSGNVVDVAATLTDSDLTLDSLIDLTNHELRVTYR